MNTDLLKKYGLLGITIVLVGYGVYLLWFLYSAIYQPLFLESVTLADSNKYEIPDAKINNVKALLEAKHENRVDVSNIPNPFINSEITVDPSVLNTETILDSPENIGELGRPE